MAGCLIGAPNYMAPECLNHGRVDHRSDIFSLGVMFYEMLTGTVPRGVFQPASEKAGTDSRLDQVVRKAMQSDPDLRYQQASDIKSDVVELVQNESIQPASGSAFRGHRAAVLLGILMIVLAAASFAVYPNLGSGAGTQRGREGEAPAEPTATGVSARREPRPPNVAVALPVRPEIVVVTSLADTANVRWRLRPRTT